MPIKPNHISAPSKPSIDDQNISKPARVLKQAVARLAKPFKGFASRNDKAAIVQPPDLQNKAPTPQMLAEARKQAQNMIARTTSSASAAPDHLFSSPELNECRLKLINIRLLVVDIEGRRVKLSSTLADNSKSSQENQLQIRYELLKVDDILSETNALKTEIVERLSGLFESQVQKIKNHVDNLQSKLASSSGSKQLHLRTQIVQAEFELMKLNAARDDCRL